MAMPSPVLMAPLVVNGKPWPAAAGGHDDRPGPELEKATAAHFHGDHAAAFAVFMQQVESAKNSSKRSELTGTARMSGTGCAVCGIRSCRRHTRCASFFMPPNARTATEPSSSRLQGQPQCSSCTSSTVGPACRRKFSTTSWSHSQSPPLTVSFEMQLSSESSAPLTPAAPPSAATGVATHGIDLGDQRNAQFGI